MTFKTARPAVHGTQSDCPSRARYRRPWLIAASNAPVIVAEGEKKADKIESLFPGHVGASPAGGT
jgi:hypothetical protein